MTAARIGKISAIGGAVIFALIVGVAVLVKILVSPETVKRTILPKISARIERQVTLGDVEVSIFRGIRLRNLEVREKDGSSPFLQAGAIRLSYRFWPLLAGRVEVDEVLLEEPLVRVVRYPDGTFNYSDLMKKEPARTEEPREKSPLHLDVSTARVSGGRMLYEDRCVAGGRGYSLEVTGVGLSASNISLEGEFPFQAEASLAGTSVALKGTLAKVKSAPAVTADLTVVAKDLGATVKGLPPAVGDKLAKMALAGGVEAQLKLAGEVKQPKQLLRGGEVKLNSLALTAGGIRPTLAGTLVLGSDSLESRGVTLTVGGQKLGVNLGAKNLLARPVKLTLSLEGDKVDLDQVLPAKKAGGVAPAPAQPREEPAPLAIPVEAGGTMRIGTMIYHGLATEGLSLAWQLQENVLTLESLKGNLAGGSFSDIARVDLRVKGFAYSTSLEVKGVQADKLVAAFAPKAGNALSGSLTLKADLAGRGVAALQRNLVGNGSFDVANGRLSGDGFMPTLAAFLGVDELRALRFSKLDGTFAIRNGVITLDAKGDGSDAKIAAAGKVGMDKSLDMGIELKLAPAITSRVARGGAGRYMADKDGWGSVPLRAAGMVGKPSFSLDTAKVGSRAVESLRQKIGERLIKQEGSGGEKQSPGRKTLNDTLRGILGN
ncbi:MAG TPA: AsmA family protein [Geobacteraceae bacterium]|nr:AsmA family protein [Geobacteraceae bacterium]